MLDLVSNGTGRVRHRRIVLRGGARRFPHRQGAQSVKRGSKGSRSRLRCMTETPFGGVEGEFVSMPPRNVVPKPVQKPHPPLWVAASRPRHHPARRREGHRRAQLRFRRTGGRPPLGRRLPTGAGRALRTGGTRGQPTGRLCDADDVRSTARRTRSQRGLEGANFFGYSLAHFYVFGEARPRDHRRVEGVPRAEGQDGLLARSGAGCRAGGARGEGRGRRPHRFAGCDRDAGPAARVPPALRRGRCRSADLRDAGREEPPRGHHGITGAVRHRGPSRVRGDATARPRRRRRPVCRRWSSRRSHAASETTR